MSIIALKPATPSVTHDAAPGTAPATTTPVINSTSVHVHATDSFEINGQQLTVPLTGHHQSVNAQTAMTVCQVFESGLKKDGRTFHVKQNYYEAQDEPIPRGTG